MQSVLVGKVPVKQGDKFGKRTVSGIPFFIRRSGGHRVSVCVAECECGHLAVVEVNELRRERGGKRCMRCGAERLRTHGECHTTLYKKWAGIKRRCWNKNDRRYPDYGGRGIDICKEWHAFPAFKAWAESNGYAPGLEIDRIDNDRNYEPSNCRWATHTEQARNKRTNVWIEAFGERKLLADWGRDSRCPVDWRVLRKRLLRGWEPERAITAQPS
jgi:hypothetical protein